MKELHSEWFPIDYPQTFYDRMNQSNVLAIGCFYKIEVELEVESGNVETVVDYVMIGTIYSRIERENRKNESAIAAIDQPRWNRQTWMERAREFCSCSRLIISERTACYIMTIGVLDECRKMGLGTKMLSYTIDKLEREYKTCCMIWLHVIDYNRSAIAFYAKNGFIKYQRRRQHYFVDKTDYDGIVLFRGIDKCAKNNERIIKNELKSITDFLRPAVDSSSDDSDQGS